MTDTDCWRLLHEAICAGEDRTASVRIRTSAVVAALESLLLGDSSAAFRAHFLETNADINVIAASQQKIVHSIGVVAGIASASGMDAAAAHRFAYDWVAHLQGALMLFASWRDASFLEGVFQRLSDLANGPNN